MNEREDNEKKKTNKKDSVRPLLILYNNFSNVNSFLSIHRDILLYRIEVIDNRGMHSRPLVLLVGCVFRRASPPVTMLFSR